MGVVQILKKKYKTLNVIRISKENLLWNYKYFVGLGKHGIRAFANAQDDKAEGKFMIAPVLKSNAYGHGIVQVAKILDSFGAPFFCVDSLHEAYQLLRVKIKTPILIMGYVCIENLMLKKLPFSYAVFSINMLLAIKKSQPHAGIHIFVDTGMHREGVLLQDLPRFVKKAQSLGLKIEGLMSHFGMADKPDAKETKQQVTNFIEAQKIVYTLGVFPKFMHIAATSGVLHQAFFAHNDEGLGNVARVGIGIYGIDPEKMNIRLKQVLTFTSTIIQIKRLNKGETLGYSFTYRAKKDMKIAILPAGYNDGVNRKLSNKGFVKIKDVFCPIIGRVSMNITIVDVSLVKNVKVGDAVIIYSSNTKDKNSIFHAAKMCGVLSYEILIGLQPSTKRIIV